METVKCLSYQKIFSTETFKLISELMTNFINPFVNFTLIKADISHTMPLAKHILQYN